MEIKRKIGKRIQELRLQRNLKQSELAEMVSIATKTQSCIETGKNFPSAELLERYAKVFKIDISEVLNITHIKTNEELIIEIEKMIKKANEQEISIIYKILKGIIG